MSQIKPIPNHKYIHKPFIPNLIFSNNHYFDKFFYAYFIFFVHISQPVLQNISVQKNISPMSIYLFPNNHYQFSISFYSLIKIFISCPISTFQISYLWISLFSYETITIETQKGGNFYGKIRYRRNNQHIS